MERRMFTTIVSVVMLLLAGCNGNEGGDKLPVEVSEINLNKDMIEIVKGETFQLVAEVLPEDAKDKSLLWSSDNVSVAIVDQSGLVSALEKGQSKISVSCGEINAECSVYVVGIPVSDVILNEESVEIKRGETFQLTAQVLPADADNKEVQWKSSDSEIVAVNGDGVITALKAGTAVVTACAGAVESDCAVTVVPVEVESVTLNETSLDMVPGSQYTLVATVLPENSDERNVIWSSSDESVLTVDAGVVTAVAEGEASVTASCGGKEAECFVTVEILPAQRGDFYYSDGTWSSELDASKTPIAIVFWVGDPTVNDPAMKADYPDCVNGLAVSIHEYELTWQKDYPDYLENAEEYGGLIGNWIDANASDLMSTTSTSDLEANLNKVVGYNNTKAIQRFNGDPANSEWKVDVVEYIPQHQERAPAPASSTGWYLPSAKELTMFCWGEEYSDNIFYMDIPNVTLAEYNSKIEQISGADRVLYNCYWSSTELDYSPGSAIYLYYLNSNIRTMPKTLSYSVRYILAF